MTAALRARPLKCTPHGRIRNPMSPLPIVDIIYDCGDPWEILRRALTTDDGEVG